MHLDHLRAYQDVVSADQYNQLVDIVERVSRVLGTGGIHMMETAGGLVFAADQPEESFWARLTASGNDKFGNPASGWIRQLETPTGDLIDDPGNERGDVNTTPAYPVANKTQAGSLVRMWPGYGGQSMLYENPGSGAASLASTVNGGSVSVPPNTSTPLTWTNGYGPFWSGGRPTRLTVPAGQSPGGVYTMTGEMQFIGIGINYHISAAWCVNGSYPNPVDMNGLCDGLNQLKWYDHSWQHLNAGDYVELAVWHDAPSAIRVVPLQAWIRYEGVF